MAEHSSDPARGSLSPTLPETASRPIGGYHLPTPLTSLLGRERETATIEGLLRQREVRLLTLTGPGGVGKTRLALEAAAGLAGQFPDGVWFVSLAPLAAPSLVLTTIAHTVGAHGPSGPPSATNLTAYLRDRVTLLLLDNLEHLLAAVPMIVALLEACPEVKALVTSRERLRVAGERELAVPPLAVPDRAAPATAASLAGSAPIQLFVERAVAVAPGFALTDDNAPAVAEICRRLDGLPLAIELAAARSKVLPPAALLARLERRLPLLVGGSRDSSHRLRTMRDAIAWSHDLLTPDEQALFRALAVFTDGCSLEAAEAVVREPGARPDPAQPASSAVLDLVTSLVDTSLLRPDLPGPRFTMLETVREYAQDLLAASGEEETVRRRHAAWCLTIAEQVEADAFAGGWERSLDRMDPEYDNLRSALGWATRRSGEATTVGLRLACALWLFWFQRGHADEGRRWFARALATAEDNATVLAGKTRLGMASLIGAGGDLAGAMAVGQDCLALYQSLDDRLGVARSFHLIGSTAHQLGDLVRAVSCLEQAIAGYVAEGGEQIWLATATAELGVIAYCRGQRDLAASLLDRAAAMQRELGPTWPSMFTVPSLNQLAAPGPGAATMPAAAAGAGPAARLSPREQEILRLIATGQTNQAIADVLCISPRTVSTHAANILSKLDLASRAEAIAFAYRHRLV